jgi:hypothetical protein
MPCDYLVNNCFHYNFTLRTKRYESATIAQLAILYSFDYCLNVWLSSLPAVQYLRFLPFSSFLLVVVTTAIPYFLYADLLPNTL